MTLENQLQKIICIQTEIVRLGLDLGGVMGHVVEELLLLLQADGAVIELVDNGELVYRAASGIALPNLGQRYNIDDTLTGLCIKSKQPLTCADTATDPRVDHLACQEMGLRSLIAQPLIHRGTTFGVLKAESSEPAKFKEQDLKLLGMLSDVVAAAIHFSVTYDSNSLFIRATHDNMTGLANRALFMDRLENTLARTAREQSPSGVLMIDMDGLKQVNDAYGHRVGDAVIVEFSNRLKKAIRNTDTTARLGGDEFGVILSPLHGPEGIDAAIKRIRTKITGPFEYEGNNYMLDASIGSALMPNDGKVPETILNVADQRMYATKKERKRKLQAESIAERLEKHVVNPFTHGLSKSEATQIQA